MMQTIDLRGLGADRAALASAVPRAADADDATASAQLLIDAVREGGSSALAAQAERFDGGAPAHLRVPRADLVEALAGLDSTVRSALEQAIARVRVASAAQVPASIVTEVAPGAVVTQRWVPVRRVGLYVPGGKAVYPSSVVMNVVPAQVAGVESIALASPPQRDFGGRVHPTILAAAELLGVDEVYAMGGAGAVGAFAYGVPDADLEPVDVITGPGNVFVASAKRLVSGIVGIDAEAGPTEILIVADGDADADLLAADLVSQAEHDERAAAVLVTHDERLVAPVLAAVAERVAATAHGDRARIALEGEQSAIVLVDSLDAAMAFSDAYAPEHLEIHTADARERAAAVRNAGAVFVGASTPVSLGDYLAGSNHVLPTVGQARFRAGLGAAAFLRSQQTIEYTPEALAEVAADVVALANAEDLPAHGEAITARGPRSER